MKTSRLWSLTTTFLARWILNLEFRVEGAENLPKGSYLVASKHQSAWETVIFSQLLDDPSIVLKEELSWIPLFNLYLFRLNFITLKRKAGAKAIKNLLLQARACRDRGQPIVIFPEGTRSRPGEVGNYQPGIIALYRDLGIPVVPVALNSGVYWGRRSFLKSPGIITLRFLKPIQPGLDKVIFMETLTKAIEENCRDIGG